MKRTIIILSATILMAGTIFTGCQSTAQKQDAAQAKVKDARQDLNEAKKDAYAIGQEVATAEEWATFRSESEVKIRDNEVRIAELNVKMKKPGQVFDELYAKKIANLELQNKEMRVRLIAYEKSQSNWETFKREFNHDMDELGKALKDLTVDNTK
jgi:outer membrane murein-binding lipoprotein Lpp